ncbi:MAG: NAD+ synthase [cyanobacterium endosymbiont of Rhopalodia musculus]|uniref:NAD+ synthase n=1 Tax=cyanobacterium endosymbiont of Epithemia clementina EcSB TaxID=3034674 RepID=UPI00247FB3D6|nr:NAD+ synthase [cyanobacterium endosymbiont of Epithemia clementina EcSB]WGT68506.1 NAD+ synthase [cyanobacterium endosymbiont of Epithemia clementina EcSB]
MKIAIAQLNPTIGDLANNAKKIVEAARFAAHKNARLLLTPELSLCGYPPRDLLLDPSFIKSLSIELQNLAEKSPSQLAILVGTVTSNPDAYLKGEKPLFNSIAWLENSQVKKIFHKRLLPTYDVFDEDRYFEPGRQSNYFELFPDSESSTPLKIGITICEDLWNDEKFWGNKYYEHNPLEDLLKIGVDFILNLSASPYSIGKQKVREKMIKYSSKYYNIPIIYVNQIGGNDDLIFDGNSFAVNKNSEIVLRLKAFEENIDFINFKIQDKDLSLSRKNDEIKIEEEEIWLALVLGVKDYVRKCGFSQVVLGLSGGIDSALVAAIATEALGKENVLALLMPSPYSSPHSIIDAEALVKNLGINSHKLPIGDVMKSYKILLDPLFKGTEFGIAEENIQSRIRGNLLMAIANKFGHLLLSTGNKSEMAVGYCTLYGDMNGGLAVISDVPKTRVFSLCRWLNCDKEIIPHNILIKSPSAELKPNQTDQDSLPSYEVLDEILERLIYRHQSVSQINEAGFDLATTDKVIKLVTRAEFKRKQASPGLRVTDRAFGTGWKMPIANRWRID